MNLTKKENILLAQRTLTENVFHSLIMYGYNVSINDIDRVIDNAILKELNSDELRSISSLLYSWSFLFKNIDSEISINLLKDYHKCISFMKFSELNEIGYIKIEVEDILNIQFERIKSITDYKDMAIELFLILINNDIFTFGDELIAQLITNHVLIKNGCGIFTIKPNVFDEYQLHFKKYVKTNDKKEIKDFLLYKCVCSDINYKSLFELEKELKGN